MFFAAMLYMTILGYQPTNKIKSLIVLLEFIQRLILKYLHLIDVVIIQKLTEKKFKRGRSEEPCPVGACSFYK